MENLEYRYIRRQLQKLATLSTLFIVLFCFLELNAEAFCVDSDTAKLYAGPNSDYAVNKTVIRHTPLKGLAKKGSWIQVSTIDGTQHWISRTDLTNRHKCAVVKVEKANLRKGPGKQYNKVYSFALGKASAFKILGKKNRWLKVEEPFVNEAWIHMDLVWIQ